MSSTWPREDLRCSFCNKPQIAVKKLVSGPLAFICNECIEVCVDILRDDGLEIWSTIRSSLSRPPQASRETLADLMNELADLSVEDKWVMVGYLLARLQNQHLTVVGQRGASRTESPEISSAPNIDGASPQSSTGSPE